ncbi:MAG: hypothetical protein WC609_02285 [Candidatus Paceibacterota bacterium]|jgi:hypothetical protein
MKEILGVGNSKIFEEKEKKERPKHRYYFHGTFRPFLDQISEKGFKYTEYAPNLTISPSFGFLFVDEELSKGEGSLKYRGRYLNDEKQKEFTPSSLSREDGVLLVIEPPVDLNVHTTNQGRPNVFSSPDQIPEDIEGSIRTKIFNGNQYEIRGTPYTEIRKGETKHPGMNLNKKRVVNENGEAEWKNIDESERLKTKDTLPADCIKMVIGRSEEFERILSQFKEELKSGNPIADVLENYKMQLFDYLSHGKVEIKVPLSEADLKEIAVNMILGEIEHHIVSEIRSLYLLTEKYKGKRIFSISNRVETEKFTDKTKFDLLKTITEKINKLRKLKPSNEALNRYIDIYCKKFESEIAKEE